jgi:hypothetical protein
MYADTLSSVLNDWVDELSGDALIHFAQVCRAQMLESARDTAVTALAAELSYDRALIKVCEACGMDATSWRYLHPGQERSRLERELTVIGIDIVSRRGTRQKTKSSGSLACPLLP